MNDITERAREIAAGEMTDAQEDARLDALIAMGEGCVKVLWGHVVERGIGMNWRIHGIHNRLQGPMAVVRSLTWRSSDTGPLFGAEGQVGK